MLRTVSRVGRVGRPPGVRIPHQNRSRPSTSITRALGQRGLHLGDVPVAERVRLARAAARGRAARRDVAERDLGIALVASPKTFAMPTCASSDEPYVSAASDIHGRRQIGTNAVASHRRRVPSSHASHASNGADGSTPTAAASARTAGPTSATERGDIECSASPRAVERVRRPRCGSPRRSRRRGRARARRPRRRRRSWCRRPSARRRDRRSACSRPARRRARPASRSRSGRARRP